jgi:hypothetical protein
MFWFWFILFYDMKEVMMIFGGGGDRIKENYVE